MDTQQAYNAWAATYDEVTNRTRDLEAQAIRALVGPEPVGGLGRVIELGCGTGKNTNWLAARAEQVTAVDFSAEMLALARAKCAQEGAQEGAREQAQSGAPNVAFQQADITWPWGWAAAGSAELITCSLILEHIRDLDFVFGEAARVLAPGGRFYVGELHPFKQYLGSKARFETGAGVVQELECFVHHFSDYAGAARRAGLAVEALTEWFDEGEPGGVPRIVGWVFRRVD